MNETILQDKSLNFNGLEYIPVPGRPAGRFQGKPITLLGYRESSASVRVLIENEYDTWQDVPYRSFEFNAAINTAVKKIRNPEAQAFHAAAPGGLVPAAT